MKGITLCRTPQLLSTYFDVKCGQVKALGRLGLGALSGIEPSVETYTEIFAMGLPLMHCGATFHLQYVGNVLKSTGDLRYFGSVLNSIGQSAEVLAKLNDETYWMLTQLETSTCVLSRGYYSGSIMTNRLVPMLKARLIVKDLHQLVMENRAPDFLYQTEPDPVRVRVDLSDLMLMPANAIVRAYWQKLFYRWKYSKNVLHRYVSTPAKWIIPFAPLEEEFVPYLFYPKDEMCRTNYFSPVPPCVIIGVADKTAYPVLVSPVDEKQVIIPKMPVNGRMFEKIQSALMKGLFCVEDRTAFSELLGKCLRTDLWRIHTKRVSRENILNDLSILSARLGKTIEKEAERFNDITVERVQKLLTASTVSDSPHGTLEI